MAAASDKLVKLLPVGREYGSFINGILRQSLRSPRQINSRIQGCKSQKTKLPYRPSPKTSSSHSKRLPVFTPAFAVVSAVGFGFSSTKSELKASSLKSDQQRTVQAIVTEADRLYDEGDPLKLYDYLIQFKELQDDAIQWRLARAACDKGKELGKKNKNERKGHVYEAFEYAKKALALNESNFACHKWYAILLDYTGEYEGIKHRISNAYTVKQHFMKAIELNPRDATSMYSLGYWCFAFADLAWYQRNIAAALFASPPKSSYQEALEYFQKAEEVDPGFYSMNLVMLGRTYLNLGNTESATHYLKQAVHYPVKTPDDEQAQKEAMDLLKKLGIKQ